MKPDISFSVRRSGSGYVLVAPKYGVVVHASNFEDGVTEIEARVETILAQLRAEGIDPANMNLSAVAEPPPKPESLTWPSLWPFFIKTAVLLMVVLAVVLLMVVPVINTVVRPAVEVLRHPARLIVQVANKMDELPPARIDELRAAVKKIRLKIEPVIEEAFPAKPAPPPAPPMAHAPEATLKPTAPPANATSAESVRPAPEPERPRSRRR